VVAHAEVEASMRRSGAIALVLLLVAAGWAAFALPAPAAGAPTPLASTPVTGNISGPTLLAYGDHDYYWFNATGGPAIAANGTQVGNLTYYAHLAGSNLTGVSIQPNTSAFFNGTPQKALLTVGSSAETLTLSLELISQYQSQNESTNLSYTITVVQPYVFTLNLVAGPSVTVTSFSLTVYLDGVPVGTLAIPSLTPNETYIATFDYAALSLPTGAHTFTATLVNQHGLVTFAGGGTTYSTTFYVPGPPPSYTLWYLAGAVAFFGAIFIFVTRVAARRRAPSKK
jgi:hypothetical protein